MVITSYSVCDFISFSDIFFAFVSQLNTDVTLCFGHTLMLSRYFDYVFMSSDDTFALVIHLSVFLGIVWNDLLLIFVLTPFLFLCHTFLTHFAFMPVTTHSWHTLYSSHSHIFMEHFAFMPVTWVMTHFAFMTLLHTLFLCQSHSSHFAVVLQWHIHEIIVFVPHFLDPFTITKCTPCNPVSFYYPEQFFLFSRSKTIFLGLQYRLSPFVQNSEKHRVAFKVVN